MAPLTAELAKEAEKVAAEQAKAANLSMQAQLMTAAQVDAGKVGMHDRSIIDASVYDITQTPAILLELSRG